MNIIKENLFFVVMGAVVLLALVLFVVLVQPLKYDNNQQEAKVRNLVDDMEAIVGQTTSKKVVLPNAAAIAAAKAFKEKYDDEMKTTVDWLAKMHLRETLVSLSPDLANDAGAYKQVYGTSCDAIKKMLADKKIATTAETWHFWDWGESVPKDQGQRAMAAKELALTEELVNILISPRLHVMQVDRIEVNPDEQRNGEFKPVILTERPDRTVETYFDVYPFVLEVRMPIDRYEILLGELLHPAEGIPIYVRDVSMTRIDDDLRITKQIPPLIIGIRVDGWALDYRIGERKTTGRAPFIR